MSHRALYTGVAVKRGEKVVFGLAVLVVIAGVAKGVRQMTAETAKQPRNYYEWTEAGLAGHRLYRQMGCNSCHRAMGVGEVGVAPVLDGEGTRRDMNWLLAYFNDPTQLVPGSAHDGSLGPDFRKLQDDERRLLAAFLFGLKANPGSPSYHKPPMAATTANGNEPKPR